jgi:hypothetical protein
MTLILALLAGVGLSAAAGLRAFLPLLVLGLGARFAGFELQPQLRWLTSDAALIGLGTATVLEIAADKVPIIDHALDVVSTVIRPVAAAIASYGVLVHWPTPWAQILAIVLASGAFAIHAAKAKLRVGSSAVTAGTANPWLSLAEDALSMLFLIVAFLAPLLVLVLLILVIAAVARRMGRRRQDLARPAV